MDSIYQLLKLWGFSDEMGSAHKTQPPSTPSPPPTYTHTILTEDELAFLRKQEVAGKISLHHHPFNNTSKFAQEASSSHHQHPPLPKHQHPPQPRFVYTELYNIQTSTQDPTLHHPPKPNLHRNHQNILTTPSSIYP
jgi:hypothetical protein